MSAGQFSFIFYELVIWKLIYKTGREVTASL